MLETIREFASERLAASDEEAVVRDRHALVSGPRGADADVPAAGGTVRPHLLDRLDAEIGNLRTALTWHEQNGEAVALLDLTVALTQFWSLRSYRVEGRRWLERALALADGGEIPQALHAAAFHAASALTRTQDDHARAIALAEQALARFRALGDTWNTAAVITLLGLLERGRGCYDRAVPLHEEALDLWRDLGEPFWVALAYCDLGTLAHCQGDDRRALALLEEAVSGFRALDDPWGLGVALGTAALAFNTGSSNTAVGAAALISNTTGNGNTGVGINALIGTNFSNTTGLGAESAVTNDNQVQLGNSLTTTFAFAATTARRPAPPAPARAAARARGRGDAPVDITAGSSASLRRTKEGPHVHPYRAHCPGGAAGAAARADRLPGGGQDAVADRDQDVPQHRTH
jgi:tetratricopeptide (TPR) repeat protein